MIDSFSGENRFLSNFFIEPDGTHVEGEFQSSKSPGNEHLFLGLSPGKAKKMGRRVQLREDWTSVRDQVMRQLVCAKFSDHPELLELLLSTGDQKLIEGNYWKDYYWGVCNGIGQNRLGNILMDVRFRLSTTSSTQSAPVLTPVQQSKD